MSDESIETQILIDRIRSGDASAFGELIEQYRPRLKRLIELRLDRRLQQRLDPSDIIQEVFLRGFKIDESLLEEPTTNPYVLLRKITIWKLLDIQRSHFGSKRRDPRREARDMYDEGRGGIASFLVDSITSPSDRMDREERVARVNAALEELEPADREILILRHCEQLSRAETAETLGITIANAAKRYYRAIQRLRLALS